MGAGSPLSTPESNQFSLRGLQKTTEVTVVAILQSVWVWAIGRYGKKSQRQKNQFHFEDQDGSGWQGSWVDSQEAAGLWPSREGEPSGDRSQKCSRMNLWFSPQGHLE